MKRLVLLAAVALALGGCVHSGGDFCQVEKPIRLSAEVVDQMNHSELAAAVAHNRHGAEACNWRR